MLVKKRAAGFQKPAEKPNHFLGVAGSLVEGGAGLKVDDDSLKPQDHHPEASTRSDNDLFYRMGPPR